MHEKVRLQQKNVLTWRRYNWIKFSQSHCYKNKTSHENSLETEDELQAKEEVKN